MPIDPRLLEILVCPLTKGPLEYDREASELISRKAGLAYPVRDGIPIMLPDEARKLDESMPIANRNPPEAGRAACWRSRSTTAPGSPAGGVSARRKPQRRGAGPRPGTEADRRRTPACRHHRRSSRSGNYAVRLVFDDLHDTGIYSWEYLHQLGREQARRWATYLDALEARGMSRDRG